MIDQYVFLINYPNLFMLFWITFFIPVLSHTEKACITDNFPQILNKNYNIITVLLARAFGPTGLTKLVLFLFLF